DERACGGVAIRVERITPGAYDLRRRGHVPRRERCSRAHRRHGERGSESRKTHHLPDYSRAVDFDLAPEQKEIQELAREFAQREIEPHAAEWDREHSFPRDVFAKLAELGLMGVCVPEEYGGAGADFLSYILVLEELSRADAGVAVTVAVQTSALPLTIRDFGTADQRARLAPPLARCESI